MKRSAVVCARLFSTALALVTWTASSGAQGHQLGAPGAPHGGVHDFRLSAGGDWVVYSAEGERGSNLELHSLPVPATRAPIHLGVSLAPSAPWEITPDASRVVYLDRDLWSAPIDGSALPVRLSEIAIEGEVRDFAIAEVGGRVLFRAAPADRSFGLFVVDVDGGARPVALVAPGLGEVDAGYRTTATGQVVFTSRHGDSVQTRLYAAALDGSATSLVALSADGAHVRDFAVSPDGLRVVYRSSAGSREASELRVAPLGLGGTQETDRRLVGNTAIEDFAISLDGALVVYTTPQSGGARRALHSIPIDGSLEPLQLASDLDSGFVLDPAGRLVLFRADHAADERFALFAVRLDGSRPPARVSAPLSVEGHVGWFARTLNGVLYQAYRGGNPPVLPSDLWHVSSTSLPAELAGLDGAAGFQVGADDRCLVYQDAAGTLYGFAVGSQPIALAGNTVARAFHIAPDSERVLYLARGAGAAELYSASIDGDSAPIRLDRPDLCEHVPPPPSGTASQLRGGDVGFRDFSFGDTGSSTPTGEKPESKLWFNDGSWWGSLYNDADTAYHVYRLDFATQTWEDTGTRLDQRNSTKADVLWDDASQKLYVTSHVFTLNAQPTATNWGNLRRYSYDDSTQTYSLDTGFPVDITRGNAEALTLARDSSGRLWATWVESATVMINHSLTGDTDWGLPAALPVDATARTVTTEDISAIVAFGGNRVGVIWSNQTNTNTYFAIHDDGDAADDWNEPEIVVPGGNCATSCTDDHFSLKADGSGRVFAALKTSQTGLDDALNLVAVRDSGGWTNAVVSKVVDHHTRPILLFDEENEVLHFFATTPEDGGAIFHKSAPLSTLDFGPGQGVPFIQNALDLVINNATSTKQNVDSTTDLVVLASDRDSLFYLHNFIDIQAATHVPVITDFTPGSGAVGTAVRIDGTEFTDVNSVRFNGTAAAFDVISETRIDTHVPNGATSGKITVETDGGTAESSADFLVLDVPTITLFAPGTGPVGTVVVIRGTNFTGATSVRFNGTEADFTVVSDMRIDAVVPPGATTGKITVTTPSGTAESNAAFGVGNCPAEPTVTLWPPNHKYVTLDLESILGFDEIEILSITQDEPVSMGFNHTCDGFGVGTSVAHVRSERFGQFNGRVYSINYSANGGECAGFLTVVVPHDHSGRPAVDDGQLYDSGEGCD